MSDKSQPYPYDRVFEEVDGIVVTFSMIEEGLSAASPGIHGLDDADMSSAYIAMEKKRRALGV